MHRPADRSEVRRRRRRREEPRLVAEHERDAAVGRAESSGADPDDGSPLAHSSSRSAARYASTRAGSTSASRADAGIGETLQLGDRIDERVDAAPGRRDALPRGEEASEHDRVDGFDLAAQPRERAPAEAAEDVDVAPLALESARPELAVDDPTVGLEPGQCGARLVGRDGEPVRELGDRERRVRPRRSGRAGRGGARRPVPRKRRGGHSGQRRQVHRGTAPHPRLRPPGPPRRPGSGSRGDGPPA